MVLLGGHTRGTHCLCVGVFNIAMLPAGTRYNNIKKNVVLEKKILIDDDVDLSDA